MNPSTDPDLTRSPEVPARHGWRGLPSRALGGFLRLFFEHLYTSLAWAYDFVAWASSAGQWDAWRVTSLEWMPARGRILELGPGTGHLLPALCRRGLSAVALERSGQMVRILRRRWPTRDGPPPVARGLAQAQPFASGVFDAAVSTFPSEYILDPACLAEIQRTLRAGGRLVIVTAAWPKGPKWIDRLAGWVYRVTGQALAPDSPWTKALQSSLIPLQVETIVLPRGVVIVLHGEKPHES